MREQEKLVEDEFFRWKGDLDRVDDILVMGFEI